MKWVSEEEDDYRKNEAIEDKLGKEKNNWRNERKRMENNWKKTEGKSETWRKGVN